MSNWIDQTSVLPYLSGLTSIEKARYKNWILSIKMKAFLLV